MAHVASFRDIKHRFSLVLASLIIPTVIPFLTTAEGHIFFSSLDILEQSHPGKTRSDLSEMD